MEQPEQAGPQAPLLPVAAAVAAAAVAAAAALFECFMPAMMCRARWTRHEYRPLAELPEREGRVELPVVGPAVLVALGQVAEQASLASPLS